MTLSFVSLRSSKDSTLDATVAILILDSGQVKASLNENESVRLTSRPLGCLERTRYLPQARDWSVLARSA